MIRNVMRLMIVSAVGACTVAQSGARDETQGGAVDEIISPSTEALIRPTPAMLAAARSGDPDAMANAITPNSCVAPSTCPAEFGSCGTWSTPSFCDTVCLSSICSGGEGVRGELIKNSFRVCFDSTGTNSCTEWRQTSVLFCGC